MRSRHSARGFTLIEVMVALTIGALVVILSQRLLGQVAGSFRALSDARVALDRERNAVRWLKASWLSLEVAGTDGAFEGKGDQVSFATWLQTPEGWFRRERLRLGLDHGQVVASSGRGRVVLWDSVATLDLDYLLAPGAQAHWVREWSSPLTAPVAVRLRLGRGSAGTVVADTLFFLIKERG